MIPEWHEQDLQNLIDQHGNMAILVYTPLCGTCHLARRMLEIVMTLLPDFRLVQTNIYSIPQYTRTWQIESVPCLLLIRDGMIVRKVYAMRSVDYLYSILKNSIDDDVDQAARRDRPELRN